MKNNRAVWIALAAVVIALAAAYLALGAARAAPPKTPAPPSDPAPATADALFAALRALPGLEAQYTEQKHMALLAVPLESRGTLRYAAPGLLRREVTHPRPATLVITPDTLRITEDGKTETIDLRARTDVRLFVDALVRVLAGDRDRLAATYAIDYAPAPDGAWTLTLTPKVEPLSNILTALRLAGRGHVVTTIRVDETNGDHTLTTITAATPRTYTPAERAQLFEAPASPPKTP